MPCTPWKCIKNTTLWNHSNMCLYDTGWLWCYMTSLCDIDRMIYVGYMMQAVNDVVWYKKLEWIHMQHACMLSYVSEWYWYETFVCMMHAPYEMYECKWVTYETLWRKYERMTFSGRNDAYFGKKWSTSLLTPYKDCLDFLHPENLTHTVERHYSTTDRVFLEFRKHQKIEKAFGLTSA